MLSVYISVYKLRCFNIFKIVSPVTLDKTDLKDRTISRSAILKTTIMPSIQGKTQSI